MLVDLTKITTLSFFDSAKNRAKKVAVF